VTRNTLERVKKVLGGVAVERVALHTVSLSETTLTTFCVGPLVVIVAVVKEEEAAHEAKRIGPTQRGRYESVTRSKIPCTKEGLEAGAEVSEITTPNEAKYRCRDEGGEWAAEVPGETQRFLPHERCLIVGAVEEEHALTLDEALVFHAHGRL